MFRTAAVVAALTPLLGACVIYGDESGETVTVRMGDTTDGDALEALRAVRFDDGEMIVTVDSNGCTEVSDFEVAVTDGTPGRLAVIRKIPDACRSSVAAVAELRWTYEALGLVEGNEASIANPIRL